MAYPPWLDPYDAEPFILFSTSHIVSISVITALIVLMFLLRHHLRSWSERARRILRIVLACIMFASEIVLQALVCVWRDMEPADVTATRTMQSVSAIIGVVTTDTQSTVAFCTAVCRHCRSPYGDPDS